MSMHVNGVQGIINVRRYDIDDQGKIIDGHQCFGAVTCITLIINDCPCSPGTRCFNEKNFNFFTVFAAQDIIVSRRGC